MKKKNVISLLVLILIELYFFYKNSFQLNEMFFFVWFIIFGTFFAFRFVKGDSGLGGIGADPKFLAARFSESLYVKERYTKTRYNDFSFELIFILLAVVNFILSMISYYVQR